MQAAADLTATREIRFALEYGGRTVATIAAPMGFPLSEDEILVILDHIDREVNHLARSVTLDAVHARIADLVRVVQSTHHASDDARPWSELEHRGNRRESATRGVGVERFRTRR
jgi:hypothetical protein